VIYLMLERLRLRLTRRPAVRVPEAAE
jgi:hypothetical protein